MPRKPKTNRKTTTPQPQSIWSVIEKQQQGGPRNGSKKENERPAQEAAAPEPATGPDADTGAAPSATAAAEPADAADAAGAAETATGADEGAAAQEPGHAPDGDGDGAPDHPDRDADAEGADQIGFETALEALEQRVRILEGGGISLDDAIAAFEEGVEMYQLASKRLEAAELRIKQVLADAAGDGVRISAFDPPDLRNGKTLDGSDDAQRYGNGAVNRAGNSAALRGAGRSRGAPSRRRY